MIRILKIILFLIPVLLLASLIWAWNSSSENTDSYKLNFEPSRKDETFYFSDEYNRKKFSLRDIGGTQIAEIYQSPLSFIVNPENFILSQNIFFDTSIKSNSDWQISLVCDKCSGEKKYSWKTIFRESFKKFTPAQDFGKLKVYVKNGQSFEKANNIETFLEKNTGSNHKVFIDNNIYNPQKIFSRFPDNLGSSSVPLNLRGSHDFLVYLKSGEMDLSVYKKDINFYQGEDSVTISLLNEKETMIWSGLLPDDGNASISPKSGEEKKYSFEVPIPQEGAYKLSFKSNDSNNDWFIDKLDINTDKLIIINNVFTTGDTILFTKTNINNGKLFFYIWDKSGYGAEEITGKNNTYYLKMGEDSLNKWIGANLSPDFYKIKTKGKTKIRGDYFSPSEKLYFDPYKFTQVSSIDDADIVITDTYFKNEGSGWVNTEVIFSNEEIKKVGAYPIKIEMRNKDLDDIFSLEKTVLENSLTPLIQVGNYFIYGKKDLKTYKPKYSDLAGIFHEIFPEKSLAVANFDPKTIINYEKYARDINFVDIENNEFDFAIIKRLENLPMIKDTKIKIK